MSTIKRTHSPIFVRSGYSHEHMALAKFLQVSPHDIETGYNANDFEYGNAEYLVCDDSTADRLWAESIESYVDGCIQPELNRLAEPFNTYFDYDLFKRDCKIDGRGHSLATYDGNEEEIKYKDAWFYIYRTN